MHYGHTEQRSRRRLACHLTVSCTKKHAICLWSWSTEPTGPLSNWILISQRLAHRGSSNSMNWRSWGTMLMIVLRCTNHGWRRFTTRIYWGILRARSEGPSLQFTSASVSREAPISMDMPLHSTISVFLWDHWDWGSKKWQHVQGEQATTDAMFGVTELGGWDDPFRGSELLRVIVVRMESLAEDWKLSACGRQPLSFFLYHLILFLVF